MVIGWHFLYEGVTKINTTPSQRDSIPGRLLTMILPPSHEKDKDKEPPFSAEGYLRNATGPVAPRFRSLVPDVNGFAKLERDASGLPSRLKGGWKDELTRISAHYNFDETQKSTAEELLAKKSKEADEWFLKIDNAERIKKYYRDLRYVLDLEQSPESLPYQKTLAYKFRRDMDRDRKQLLTEVDAFGLALQDTWIKLATPEQLKLAATPNFLMRGLIRAGLLKDYQDPSAGEYIPARTSLDWINLTTMWGLTLVGLCLMLGFLTPLAALGGAVYLLNFYLSMPPWPGLPVGPQSEGHYLYINKNIIEMLGCLVIASTPNGLWLGLDSLFFGRWGRKKAQPESSGATTIDMPTMTPVRPSSPPKNPKRR